MCTREDEIANEIREEFCRRVIPSHIIRYLTCITIQDTEMVRAVEKQNGPLSAAEILLERLVVRPNWLHDLKRVLLIQDVGLLDFGENLEEKCRQSSVTVGAIEECIDGHGCREKEEQTPPTDEVKMCTREEEIANEKKDEVSNLVLLSSIITYQRCLTIQYTEMVQAVEKRDGPIYADALLLEVFVRPLDRLNDLKVFLIQDIGLLDFGEKLEEKCRQSSVTFGAIEEYIDGHGCGEKEEKTPPTDEENVKTAEKQLGPINADVGLLDFGEKIEEKCRQSNVMKSPSTDKSTSSVASIDRQESLADNRRRVILKLYDKLFPLIKSKDDIHEIMYFADQIIACMDELPYKEKKSKPANIAIVDDHRDLQKQHGFMMQDTDIQFDHANKILTILQQSGNLLLDIMFFLCGFSGTNKVKLLKLISVMAPIMLQFADRPILRKTNKRLRESHNGPWFYKLVICCDDKMVDIDSSTSMSSLRAKSLHEMISKGQTGRPKEMKQFLYEYLCALLREKEKAFDVLLTFSTFLNNKRIRPEDWLVTVVEHQHEMACYMLLAYMKDTEKDNEDIVVSALKVAIGKGDKDITNAISWFLIKKLVRSSLIKIDYLIDIWPAIVCKKNKCEESAFCSNELVVIVETTEDIAGLPRKFWNIEIKYISNVNGITMENKVKEQVCNKTKLSPSPQDCFPENFKIDGNLASKLFKMHKKSTFICKSLYKLTDGATVYRPCVQLFCKVKGFIPVKENHFPKHINNVETDILEGESVLAGQLRVGEQIQSSHYSGTLGGFVKILGEITFLTCAHVVLHKDNLCGIKLSIPDDQPIYMDCVQDSSNGQNIFRCGKLRHIEFRTDRPGETSIDAALIKLGKGIYIDENDFLANGEGNKHSVSSLGMSSPFLNENFVDYQKLFRGRHFRQFENVCIGAKSRLTVNKSNIDEMEDKDEGVNIDLERIVDTFNDVVKSENTNIAGPSTFSCTNQVVYDEAHIQQTRLMRVDNERTRRRLSRCMYNQIAITNIPFQKGDSGTCIYVHDSTLNVGGCIGMAIANNPGRDGGVVVTPMKEILKTFHVKIQ